MKGLLALVAIAVLLLPLVYQIDSNALTVERTVTLKVTNTKTGSVQTKVWDLTGYTFGERNIDVSHASLTKIKRVYHSDSFAFTLQNKVFEGEWLHFKVELSGTSPVGKGLNIKFI